MKTIFMESRKAAPIRNRIDGFIASYLNDLSKRHNSSRNQRMAIFANDWIGIKINLLGVYEKNELDVLFHFLSPLKNLFREGVALDIGANIGNHAIYFSKCFSKVYAFEPNPSTYKLLSFNSSYSTNVEPFNIGLGDEKGVFKLYEDAENLGGSSLKLGDQTKALTIDVVVERLDDLNLGLDGCCFVKIDVEGSEADVIKGGVQVIKRHQPIIVFEQLKSEFVGGTTESICLLKGMGYRFCWYRAGVNSKNWVARRLFNFIELFSGRAHRVIYDDSVPADRYSMLIAVPPRFQSQLGCS